MPKYDPLTRKLSKWLYKFIDRFDWGRFSPTLGHPMPNLSTDRLLWIKNARKSVKAYQYVRRLTMTHVQQHLDSADTIYYRCFGRASHWLLKIDIDGKGKGQTEADAERAAEFISTKVHKRLYWEPSTGGKGRHVYLVVDRGRVPHEKWKKLLAEYVEALQVLVTKKRMKAGIDRICGLPTKLSSGADKNCEHVWTVKPGNTGVLSKLPRLPMGELALQTLMESPVLTFEDFQRVIEVASKKKAEAPAPNRDRRYSDMLTKLRSFPRFDVAAIRDEANAFTRMHFACTHFVMLHNRFADDEFELRDFYEEHDFHSGMGVKDRKARTRRAKAVLNYQREHRTEGQVGAFGIDLDRYLTLVREHVTPAHHNRVKCDREVSEYDLAVGLYVIERNAMKKAQTRRRQGTTGFKAIVDMARVLRDVGVLRRGMNANQACAVRKILVNSGLAVCEDDGYYAGGPVEGWCRKFGVGEAHPQREAYKTFVSVVTRDTAEQEPVPPMHVIEVSAEDVGGLAQGVVVNLDWAEGLSEQGLDLAWELPETVGHPAHDPPLRRVVVAVEGSFEGLWGPVETMVGQLPDLDPPVDYSPYFGVGVEDVCT